MIAIEVTPISNQPTSQPLKFVDDLRNHSIVSLISREYLLVIVNDDPGLWDASGVSFDFCGVFIAMTIVRKLDSKCSIRFSIVP